MQEALQKIKKEVEETLAKIKNFEALREIETKYLGRKGELTKFLRNISSLSVEEKKVIPRKANPPIGIVKTPISKKTATKKDAPKIPPD